VSSAGSSQNWDLRCIVREGLIAYVAREFPQALPVMRQSRIETAAAEPG
jgi:hypothetical protein